MPIPQIDALNSKKGSAIKKDGPTSFFSLLTVALLTVVLLVAGYGLLICWSAVQGDEDYSFFRQFTGLGIGVVLMMIVWSFDYRKLATAALPLLIITVALILSPFLPVIGVTTMGATSWINIGMQIQPGEFAKVTMVLYASSLVAKYGGKLDDLSEYCKTVLLLMIPFVCIMLQPDLGTGLVYLFIAATVLIMGGAKVTYILATLGILVVCIACVFVVDEFLKYDTGDGTYEYRLLKNYQRSRLFVFMNQNSNNMSDEGYNLQQAMIAIGSGGLTGKGLGSSTQSSLGFLPEAPTDFIFCVLAEELGFLGILVLIGLYAALVIVCMKIARATSNLFGMLIVCAVIGMWLFQILENIGMCCGLMPITGIPLPFVSYGSSFMIVNFIMLGLIGSVLTHDSGVGKGLNYGAAH